MLLFDGHCCNYNHGWRLPLKRKSSGDKSRTGWAKILIAIVGAALLSSFLTLWLAGHFLFAKEFTPVTLNAEENQVLVSKLKDLASVSDPQGAASDQATPSSIPEERRKPPALAPQRYREQGANRAIVFTERELNALLARNTDLADKVAIKLSKDLASAHFLIPLDSSMPFFGGKTLKATAGLELRYADRHPVVVLKGISLWGIPMPSAWLGGLKNADLVDTFGADTGFWNLFAAGVASIRVEEGWMSIQLKE
jgi:hypothetical protein